MNNLIDLELLKIALKNTYDKIEKINIPKDIKGVFIDLFTNNVFEIAEYIKSNNLPKETIIIKKYNDNDDIYDFSDLVLYYEDKKSKFKDIENYKAKRFNSMLWYRIFDIFTSNGYIRIGFDASYLKEFENINQYELYKNNDLETLQKYYSLFFKKD